VTLLEFFRSVTFGSVQQYFDRVLDLEVKCRDLGRYWPWPCLINSWCVSCAVVSVDRRECHLSQPITLTTQSGSLASVTSQHLGLGTVECPWKVRVSPGQQITLSLRYFRPEKLPETESSGPAARSKNKLASNCYELATVRESGTESTARESRSVTTCDGQQRGEHELFTSNTNEISVQVVGRMMLKTLGRFIINYRGY